MDVIKQVNGTVNDGLQVINGNRIASVVLGLFLALYASLAAPNLPSSVTKIFKNPIFKLGFMFLIAYMATKDTSVAIITAVALLVTLQTLSAHETTEAVVKVVEAKINSNIEHFAAIPALDTNKYDDLLDYSLSNSEEHIYAGSGRASNPSLVEASMSRSNAIPLDERAIKATQHVFKSQLGGDTYNIIGQEMTKAVGGGPELVMQQPMKPVHNPGANHPAAEIAQPVVQMARPAVEMAQPKQAPIVVKKPENKKKNKKNDDDDDDEPSLLDLITGFENSGSVEPFSEATHYDIDFAVEDKSNNESHKHQIENFEPEVAVAGSCGNNVDNGVSVPGFDLGEFATF